MGSSDSAWDPQSLHEILNLYMSSFNSNTKMIHCGFDGDDGVNDGGDDDDDDNNDDDDDV